MKKSAQRDEQKLKRNEILWQYLIEINIKTVSKKKEHKLGLFDQGWKKVHIKSYIKATLYGLFADTRIEKLMLYVFAQR